MKLNLKLNSNRKLKLKIEFGNLKLKLKNRKSKIEIALMKLDNWLPVLIDYLSDCLLVLLSSCLRTFGLIKNTTLATKMGFEPTRARSRW